MSSASVNVSSGEVGLEVLLLGAESTRLEPLPKVTPTNTSNPFCASQSLANNALISSNFSHIAAVGRFGRCARIKSITKVNAYVIPFPIISCQLDE